MTSLWKSFSSSGSLSAKNEVEKRIPLCDINVDEIGEKMMSDLTTKFETFMKSLHEEQGKKIYDVI